MISEVNIPDSKVHLVGCGKFMPRILECLAYFHQPSKLITMIIVANVATAVTGKIEKPASLCPSSEGNKPLLIIFVNNEYGT
jgi:hypothetical protein